MGKRSRTKGHAWEREVCEMIRDATKRDAKRVLHETRDGNCGDIDTPHIPLAWQCKVGIRPDIYGAVQEARDAQGCKAYAVAVVRRNGAGRR
jgi:hypothetical protein